MFRSPRSQRLDERPGTLTEIRCPPATELMAVWEAGLGRPAHERALLLLERTCPGWRVEDLARCSLGQRDRALFRLRQALFGDQMTSIIPCPACAAEVEVSFAVSQICPDEEGAPVREGAVEMNGHEIHFRAVNSTDLAALGRSASVAQAQQVLLERCIVKAEPDGEFPENVRQAVIAGVAACDLVADRRLVVSCACCGNTWEELIDIAVWLGVEIGSWVRRTVREVHSLASAYGWREEEILGMNPTRRQLYLSLLAQA